jgi:lipoprotein NlpI
LLVSISAVCAAWIVGAAGAAAQSAESLNARGDAAVRSGNLTRAFEHYTAAISVDPFHALAIRNRARVHFYRADFVAAAEDFRIATRVDPRNGYSLLWRYVADARSGVDDRAGLATGVAAVREDWPKSLVLLFLGRVEEEAVMAQAAAVPVMRPQRECEAHFFIAQRHLLAGDNAGAARLLRVAADRCPTGMVERHAARVELHRIEKAAR